MDDINHFLNLTKTATKIEVVSDFLIPDNSKYFFEENELSISKSFYKTLLKFSVENIDKVPEIASEIGVLMGSYDSRVWDKRKQMINKNDISEIKMEINKIHLGLTVTPKCAEAFENIRFFLKDCKDQEIIQGEVDFYNYLTGKSLRNALLWRHRVWFTFNYHIEKKDLEWSEEWTKSHPADSSAFYFMETLITHFMNSDESFKYDLVKALQENTKLIFSLPGHESIWNHRRFLIQCLLPEFKNSQIPENWKLIKSPNEAIKYPIVEGNNMIRYTYSKICDEFGIDLNFLMTKSNEENSSCSLQFENENLIIAVSRGDKFPSEYAKQKLAAEKYFKWICCILLKIINNS